MAGNLINFCSPIVQEWMTAEIVELVVVNSLATQTVVKDRFKTKLVYHGPLLKLWNKCF